MCLWGKRFDAYYAARREAAEKKQEQLSCTKVSTASRRQDWQPLRVVLREAEDDEDYVTAFELATRLKKLSSIRQQGCFRDRSYIYIYIYLSLSLSLCACVYTRSHAFSLAQAFRISGFVKTEACLNNLCGEVLLRKLPVMLATRSRMRRPSCMAGDSATR